MQVLTCKNCLDYLIGGVALCKVVSNGEVATLDLETGTYYTASGAVLETAAYCPHCESEATTANFQSPEQEREHLCQMIDDLDDEIENLLRGEYGPF